MDEEHFKDQNYTILVYDQLVQRAKNVIYILLKLSDIDMIILIKYTYSFKYNIKEQAKFKITFYINQISITCFHTMPLQ